MKQLTLFLCGVVIFAGMIQAQLICTAPPAGMTNWWMAEGSALDYVGTGHGTLKDGAGFGSGVVGQAFVFPGGLARVDMPPSSFVQPTNEATIDAWVFPTVHGNAGIYGLTVFSNTDTHGLAIRIYQGKLQADFRTTVGGTNPSTILAGPVLPLNEWSHIAITYDGTAANSYVNGLLVETRAQSGPITNTINAGTCPVIGNENFQCVVQSTAYSFKGSIDEVEVFDRALDAAEILAIYNAGAAGKCRDLDADGIVDTCDTDFYPGPDYDQDGMIDGSACDTVIGPPTNRDQCKNGGWQFWTRANGTGFRNQGDCIQYVNTGK